MKQLQYVIRYLLKARGNNLIKIVSLTLGLFVGLILFAQVAFEMSYDNFYPDKEQLYLLHIKASVQGKDGFEGGVVHAPFAPTMYREFPEVISAANAYAFSWERRFRLRLRKRHCPWILCSSRPWVSPSWREIRKS